MRTIANSRMYVLAVFLAGSARTGLSQNQAMVEGIPVTHQLTIEKCGGCHKTDGNGMMGRISFIRTTPEVWQQTIKRMMRLNGVVATPAEVRDIVRYLSNNNGLAPEEMKPAFWEVEHRLPGHQADEVPDPSLQHTCNYCHNVGRVLVQRRTKDDYEKLFAFHIGLFPGAENVFRPRRVQGNNTYAQARIDQGPNGGNPVLVSVGAPAVDMRAPYPIDLTLNYLTKAQPLTTPEWTAWKATMRVPKLSGAWAVSAYQTGKGKAYGTLTIQPGASEDEFVTKLELEYAGGNAKLARAGKGIVYTGYSWRGRQTAAVKPAANPDPGNDPAEWREAMMVSRDGNSMEGRWFWGGYDEFGMDVKLTRIGSQPVVMGTDVYALQSPSKPEVRLFGANLPGGLKPADFDFGPGITVKRIVKQSPAGATVELEVSKDLPAGSRDISVKLATAVKAVTVYDTIAYVRITPDAGMARLGGLVAAKQFMQFETIAYAAGPDGKPNTSDDVPLGPVAAQWSMEEQYSTPDDDDIKFVGAVNDSGLFTPSFDGPNPARQKQSNNYPTNNWGDVWVTAAYSPKAGPKLKARSYLVVTVPQYVRYDQPEISK